MASFAEGLAQGLRDLPLLMQRKKELDERQKSLEFEKDIKMYGSYVSTVSNKDAPTEMRRSALRGYNSLAEKYPQLGFAPIDPMKVDFENATLGKYLKKLNNTWEQFKKGELPIGEALKMHKMHMTEAADALDKEQYGNYKEAAQGLIGEVALGQKSEGEPLAPQMVGLMGGDFQKKYMAEKMGLNEKETWGGLMPGPEGSQIQTSSTGKVNTVLGRPPKYTQNEDTITSNVGINPQTNKPEYLTKSGKFTGIAPQEKDGKQPSWQRKTKTFYKGGKMFAQDYDFNPVTREEKNVGTPYERRDLDEEVERQIGMYAGKLGKKRDADEEALDPAAIELAANNYVATGKMPALGMGNAVMRSRILSKAAEIAESRNIDFISLPAVQAEFQANAQNLISLNKAYNQVMAFEKTAKANIEYAQELSTKYDRSRFPDFNSFMQAVASKTGGADIEAFRQAVYAASMEYMKVITAGSGVSSAELSVKAQEKAEDILNAAKTKNQFDAIIATMKVDMENRDIGYKAQISEIKSNLDRFSKKGGEAPQAKIKTADDYLRAKGLK